MLDIGWINLFVLPCCKPAINSVFSMGVNGIFVVQELVSQGLEAIISGFPEAIYPVGIWYYKASFCHAVPLCNTLLWPVYDISRISDREVMHYLSHPTPGFAPGRLCQGNPRPNRGCVAGPAARLNMSSRRPRDNPSNFQRMKAEKSLSLFPGAWQTKPFQAKQRFRAHNQPLPTGRSKGHQSPFFQMDAYLCFDAYSFSRQQNHPS